MISKKNPKVDVGRNSGLYFAIGLNLMLLLSWQALEFKTYEKKVASIDVIEMVAQIEEDIPVVPVNTELPPPPPVAVVESIEIVEDVVEIEETVIESSETTQEEAIEERVVNVEDIEIEEVTEDVEVPFAVLENVPVFPGCEGKTKSEIKACFQTKIQEHVRKHFKYPDSAVDLGIQGRVFVLFVIDSKGHTINVKSRGPDKILEKEAERIIKLLPQMEPGTQRGKPVKVSYAIPIYFKMESI
ncbi:energy transducer TonB [Snuella sedimenti]|uniref:TonB family protein n=1 Tax=Snuella sedimenti TaxID=2798802 RepID=A0A8J7JCK9_9FLAO|nr:energy transducer TonB [Snuella sedimenti]MBJ6368524.1 TonB family protein [Snuella sedimenti]